MRPPPGQEKGSHAERQPGLQMKPQPVRVAVEEPAGIWVRSPAPSPDVVGRGGAPMRHPGRPPRRAMATTSWPRTPEARLRSRRRRRRAHDGIEGARRRSGGVSSVGADGNRPGGSAAHWRPWSLLSCRAPAAGEAVTRAIKKARSTWERAGVNVNASFLYPVAPLERTRLRLTIGVLSARFMDALLCIADVFRQAVDYSVDRSRSSRPGGTDACTDMAFAVEPDLLTANWREGYPAKRRRISPGALSNTETRAQALMLFQLLVLVVFLLSVLLTVLSVMPGVRGVPTRA